MGCEKVDNDEQKNLEEVETTLDEIRRSSAAKSPRPAWVRFFAKLFSPVKALFGAVRRAFSRMRVPITVKTTFIFTLLFTIAVVLIDAFIVRSVASRLADMGISDRDYINELVITSVILIIVSVAVVAGLGSLVCQSMLSPIRRMLKRIDSISADDLTTRLDDVDSQDELRELTERINAMLDKLEQSFERQKKFVSDASHELKTPISVIRGYSGLLRRWGKDDPEVLDESIECISREADNMKRIVEQLLMLAKMGQYIVTEERVDVGAELRAVVESYRLLYPDHVFVADADAEVVTITDRYLFTECVRAITDNAVKYSDAGTAVEIALSRSGGTLSVSIADHGVGIEKGDLMRIFDRFYRCDRSRGRAANSSGLGLTIALTIARTLGGDISVESEPGVGSVFTIKLPVREGKNND